MYFRLCLLAALATLLCLLAARAIFSAVKTWLI
jgi:hypothetical protein